MARRVGHAIRLALATMADGLPTSLRPFASRALAPPMAVLRAGAQALAAMARRVGHAIRLALATMADGLRRIGARILVLARATATLLARPFRLAFAALRRFASRVMGRMVVLFFDVIGLISVAAIGMYGLAAKLVRSVSVRIGTVTGAGRWVIGLSATEIRRLARFSGDVVATVWALMSRAARSAGRAVVAAAVAVWTPLRSGMARAARVVTRLATSGWAAVVGAAQFGWRRARSVVGATRAMVTRVLTRAAAWVARQLSAVRIAVVRIVSPISRALLLLVGAVLLGTVKVLSKARAMAALIRHALAASVRRATQRIRVAASTVSAAVGQSLSSGAQGVRRTVSGLRVRVRRSTERASTAIRQASASVRLSVRRAKDFVVAAIQSARELLGRMRPGGPPHGKVPTKPTRPH